MPMAQRSPPSVAQTLDKMRFLARPEPERYAELECCVFFLYIVHTHI